ncbi:Sister chromatid cohesion protein pds5 [Sorochytrium milnesiophthora]
MTRSSKAARGNSSAHSLQFNEKLVAKDKSITPAELVRRLQTLHGELATLVQEQTDTESLSQVARQLVSPSLISHKDKGVRVLTACCLADILRLYAPTPPYDSNVLQDVFDLLVRQLGGIAQIDGPYYSQHKTLLENLATVRSLALMADLSNVDELVITTFNTLLGSIRRNHSKDVYEYMLDILHQLIDEVDTVPTEVADAVLEYCGADMAKEKPVAHRLAVDLCNISSCTDNLQRFVCQQFSESVQSALRNMPGKASDLQELEAEHQIVKQLHSVAPGLLKSVLPQMAEELTTDHLAIRLIATSTLGDMFSEAGSNLVRRDREAWMAWLNRRRDREVSVRIKMLSYLPQLLKTQGHVVSHEVNEVLRERLCDVDDRSRAEACRVLSQIDFGLLHQLVQFETLFQVGLRCRDRRPAVRLEAVRALFHIWDMVMDRILPPDGRDNMDWKGDSQTQTQSQTDTALSQLEQTQGGLQGRSNLDELDIDDLLGRFGWIPEATLSALAAAKDAGLKAEIEDAIITKVVHAQHIRVDDLRTRVERFLYFLACLEGDAPYDVDRAATSDYSAAAIIGHREGARTALAALFASQASTIAAVTNFVRLCRDHALPQPDDKLEALRKQLVTSMTTIGSTLPDGQRAQTHLDQYRANESTAMHGLLLKCMDWENNDLRTIRKAGKELIRAINSRLPDATASFTVLSRRLSPFIFCKEMIPVLLERMQDTERATVWDKRLRLASAHLLQAYLGIFSNLTAFDVKSRLLEYTTHANLDIARYAAKTLALAARQATDSQLGTQIETLADIVSTKSPTSVEVASALAALSEISACLPVLFEEHAPNLSATVVSHILTKQHTEQSEENSAQWVEFDDVDVECRAKVCAVRMIARRVVGISTQASSNEVCVEASKPVLRLLYGLLQQQQQAQQPSRDDLPETPLALLRLYRLLALKNVMPPALHISLSLTAQHTIYDVRKAFVEKLTTRLSTMQLPPMFISTVFLVAHDPEPEIKERTAACVQRLRQSYALQGAQAGHLVTNMVEISLARLLHLLSHHPDFALGMDQLQILQAFVDFYLDLVASKENIALLFHVCMKVKQKRDRLAIDEGLASQNLYVMSDLAMHAIRERAKRHQWPLQTYTGPAVSLPWHDVLESLSRSEGSENCKRTFLPDEYTNKPEKPAAKKRPSQIKPRRRTVTKAAPKPAATPKRHTPPRLAKVTLGGYKEDDSEDEAQDEEEDDAMGGGRSPSKPGLDSPPASKRSRFEFEEEEEEEDKDAKPASKSSGSGSSRPKRKAKRT